VEAGVYPRGVDSTRAVMTVMGWLEVEDKEAAVVVEDVEENHGHPSMAVEDEKVEAGLICPCRACWWRLPE
jgi:hypothetical protein